MNVRIDIVNVFGFFVQVLEAIIMAVVRLESAKSAVTLLVPH